MKPGLLALAALAWLATEARAADPAYSPKLSFRVGNGLLRNGGTAGGSANSIGGLNLLFNYFLQGDLALGLGFTSSPPFSTFAISGRYYFSGQGTRSRHQQEHGFAERRDLWAHYVGLDMAQTSYVMTSRRESSTLSDTVTGSTATANLTLGMDLRISRHFEFTVEANTSLLVLAATNTSIQMKSYLLNTGLSYVW